MNINDHYYKLVIEENYYYFRKKNKPTQKSIHVFLKKIEIIINNSFEYNPNHKHNLLFFDKTASDKVLPFIASQSYKTYKKLNKNKIKNKIKKNDRRNYARITNFYSPFLQLPNEMIYAIIKDLCFADLICFAQTSRFCNKHAMILLTSYAKKFGYKKNTIPPIIYLNKLLYESTIFYPNLNLKKIKVNNNFNQKWVNFENHLNDLSTLKRSDLIKSLSDNLRFYRTRLLFKNFQVNYIQNSNFQFNDIEKTLFKDFQEMDDFYNIQSIFFSVIFEGDQEFLKLLLEKNTNPNIPYYREEKTALHCLLNPSIAKMLIKYGAKVNQRADRGISPLHSAVNNGSISLAEILLENGAEVNIQDDDGKTAFHYIGEHRFNNFTKKTDVKMSQLLFKYEASINAQDHDGDTPLHFAVRKGTLNAVKFFLNNGADPNIQNNEALTPLAVLASRNEIVERKNLDTRDLKILKLLIKFHAQVDAVNHFEQTTYDLALAYRDKKIAKSIQKYL